MKGLTLIFMKSIYSLKVDANGLSDKIKDVQIVRKCYEITQRCNNEQYFRYIDQNRLVYLFGEIFIVVYTVLSRLESKGHKTTLETAPNRI